MYATKGAAPGQTPDLANLELTTVQLDLTRNAHLFVYKERPNFTSLVTGQLNNLQWRDNKSYTIK